MTEWLRGVDVSKWQGKVAWKEVAVYGIQFAICKATEGVGYRDPRFKDNWKGIADTDMYRSAYHFARVSRSPTILQDSRDEADSFLEAIGELGERDLPPVLDIEWDKRAKGIKPPEIIAWCLEFLNRVEDATGRTPMVYTGRNFWRWKLARTAELARFPLWQVQYSKKRKKPREIEGWPATIWQWSHTERVPGIRGKVDANRFLGTELELDRLAGPNKSPPTEPTQPRIPIPFSGAIAWLCEEWNGIPERSAEG